MDLEAGSPSNGVKAGLYHSSFVATLSLAYQSLGVVYGDLSTSPLYVYQSAFSGNLILREDNVEILGVLSLVLYTITLVPVVKYILIVLNADDNGEGGPFALYSLLCRHAHLSLLPNQQELDEELSNYGLKLSESRKDNFLKQFLGKHNRLKSALLVIVLLGSCMVIGDGILTPAISVTSAVSGIQVAIKGFHSSVIHLLIAIILIGIFALQHFGTHKIAFMFAPIVLSWLFCIASIGLYNTLHWNPGVFRAVSPFYIYNFMKRTRREGWASLGGILLCITGTEDMFADLGHFSQPSIKLAFTCTVYPSLFLAYLGQAAYLTKNHTDIRSSFYKSLPRPLYWPTFVIATLASIVSSQAVISAAFSIVKQCSALGCFPRVKVIHTSKNVSGQIYIPEVNWILLVLCLAVTIGFGDAVQIGNAYGIAVLSVMFVTTFLMTLVMHIVWKWNIFLALGFCVFFGFIEGLYLSAALTKFPRGGWVPVALSVVFMAIMYSWHYGTIAKYKFNMENKVSMKWLLSLGPSLQIVRVPGIGLMYTELATGVPAIFSHFVANLPAFHQIVVLVCVKSVPVPHVPVHERYLVGRVGPKEYRMYRCIVRFGYKDNSKDDNDFETRIMLNIGEFIQTESAGVASRDVDSDPEGKMIVVGDSNSAGIQALPLVADGQLFIPKGSSPSHIESPLKLRKKVKFDLPQNPELDASVREELAELVQAQEAGVAYLMGHSHVRARRNSSVLKKLIINVVYNFLRRNSRGPHAVLSVPHTSLIEVGMLCLV